MSIKSKSRILVILIFGGLTFIGIIAFTQAKEFESAKEICEAVGKTEELADVIKLSKHNDWHIKELRNSMKIGVKEYSCFCLLIHNEGKVLENHGAYCYD